MGEGRPEGQELEGRAGRRLETEPALQPPWGHSLLALGGLKGGNLHLFSTP